MQGGVAWATLTLEGIFSADSAQGRKFLHLDTVAGNPRELQVTYVESEVLVKTSSGWKITLGHPSRLPKAQK